MVDENTIEQTELLCGRWKLLCTYKEDVDVVEFFDVGSWQRYLFEKGPSPVQSLVLGNTSTVENVYQVLEDPKEAPERSGKTSPNLRLSSTAKGKTWS